MSDTEIDIAVTDELKWNPRVDDTALAVSVRSGIVTVAGYADSFAKKHDACDAAHRVKGVLDEIQVRHTGNGVARVEHALVVDVFT